MKINHPDLFQGEGGEIYGRYVRTMLSTHQGSDGT
jgi:hypothetical protein